MDPANLIPCGLATNGKTERPGATGPIPDCARQQRDRQRDGNVCQPAIARQALAYSSRTGTKVSTSRTPFAPATPLCARSEGTRYASPTTSSRVSPATVRVTDPSTTTPSCSCTWLCSATIAPGSMAIQQVMNDSPITGWIWIPGAGENGGTSDRRTQVAPVANLESDPGLLTSTVPDIVSTLPQCDSGPPTGAASSRYVRNHCRR